MTPADKVRIGLALAREGFADLRDERSTLARWLAENRAAIAGGEQEALSLRFEATRGRADRVLSGSTLPRSRLRDGVLVAAPSMGEETARSLALYCPTGASRRAGSALRRGLLARWFSGGDGGA